MFLTGIYALQGFMKGNTCSLYENYPDLTLACDGSFTVKGSIANIQTLNSTQTFNGPQLSSSTYKSDTHGLLIFIYVLVTIIIIFFIRKHHQKEAKELDEDWIKPSDFTIEVKNIPLDQSRQQIADFFENNSSKTKKPKIYKVVKAYNISEFCQNTSLKANLIRKLKKKLDENTKTIIEDEIEALNEKLKVIESEFQSSEKKFTGVAYVTFQNDMGIFVLYPFINFISIFQMLI